MKNKELRKFLEEEGYMHLKQIKGRGICGIKRFIFTTAIVYGLDEYGYKGRYCYPHHEIAALTIAYSTWDGGDDPIGPWIKHKRDVEYSNSETK